jgi:hypothetical protein
MQLSSLASALRAGALHPRAAPARRRALFVASLVLLAWSDRVVRAKGVEAARQRFLRARRPTGTQLPREVCDELDAAIASAAQWLPFPAICLPRSLTAYAIGAALGGAPTHRMGVRARPFYGHAWTSFGDQVVGDALAPAQRAPLHVVKCTPPEAS